MEDYIDIADRKGKLTGVSASKSEIHSKGHFHHTAHIWFFTSDGEILLQQRAASKLICPLLWDVSVAGHVDAGETIEQAAIRETKEEIGISISEEQLIKIGVFDCFQSYSNGIIDNEFHNTFIVKLNLDIGDFTPNLNEVEALKFVTMSEFNEKLEHSDMNNHFISSNKTYYQFVLETIKNNLAE
ncbi:NUDIX hydrolase [Psychroserpens luteolus]|uniref:NUDIX hydrolase n=1 Tax=Psychroserpens luteolus TaxID=2855840 RepID=UPI001E63EDC3|nr:NUDIX domain-containing protein [Psychroserpens luteolus]MCD2259392.1 NUDIX domain-containing protein [Psychroserpens luteolus]